MAWKICVVTPTEEEHRALLEVTRKGERDVCMKKRAMILLKADKRHTDPQIMGVVQIHRPTMERIHKHFAEGGLKQALNEDPRPGHKRKFYSRGEAQLFAFAGSEPPSGHGHWSLRLMGDKLVELGVVEPISYEMVRQTLRKTS